MSLSVIHTSDDRLASAPVCEALSAAVAAHGRAALLVPDFQAQLEASRQLAGVEGLSMGVTVTTPEAWVKERWEVWGDGTHVVEPMVRTMALQAVVSQAASAEGCPLGDNLGTVNMLARLAERALPWLPIDPQGQVNVVFAQECGLTRAECVALGLLGTYSSLIESMGYVEGCVASARLVGAMTAADAAKSVWPTVAAGFDSLSRARRDLLSDLVAVTDVSVVATRSNAAATALLDADLALLLDSARTAGVSVEEGNAAGECEPDSRDVRAQELRALIKNIFGAERVEPAGAVSVVTPAGPVAESEAICREARRLADAGCADVVVSVPDAAVAWRNLAPKLACRGVSVQATMAARVDRLEAGRAFFQFAGVVARLAKLRDEWPQSEKVQEGTLVHLGDMSWWPPRDLTDFLLSSISDVPTGRAMALDARWRADRLLTPADVLDLLQNRGRTSDSVAAATRELLKGRLGSAASKLLAPFVSGGFGPLDEVVSADGAEVLLSVERPQDSLADQQAMGALGAVLDIAGVLKELGVTADPKAERRVALTELVALATRAASHVKVATRVRCEPEGAGPGTPVVRLVDHSRAATLPARSADAVIVCGQTSVEEPLPTGDDVATALLVQLGVEVAPDAVGQARSSFVRRLSVARRAVSLERTLFDADSKERYPSVMLSELLAAYGQRGGELCVAESLSECEAAAMVSPCGRAPEVVATDAPAAAGVVSGPARALVNVPREGRPDLLDGRPVLSASQIESYLECPYKWFSLRRLRLQNADAGFGPMEMGTFVHRVLEVTHSTLLSEALGAMEPSPDVAADPRVRVPGSGLYGASPELLRHAKDLMLQELADHLRHQFIREGKSSRYQALVPHDVADRGTLESMRDDVLSVLDYQRGILEGFEPRMFEWNFGHGADRVGYAGAWLNGTIDRVDVDAHGSAIVIDYKNKKSSGFAKEYGALLASKDSAGFVLPRRVQSLVYGQVIRRRFEGLLSVKGAMYLSTKGRDHALSGAVDADQMERVYGDRLPSKDARAAVGVERGADFGIEGETGMDALLDATEAAIAEEVARMMDGCIEARPRDAKACDYCPVSNCEKRMN